LAIPLKHLQGALKELDFIQSNKTKSNMKKETKKANSSAKPAVKKAASKAAKAPAKKSAPVKAEKKATAKKCSCSKGGKKCSCEKDGKKCSCKSGGKKSGEKCSCGKSDCKCGGGEGFCFEKLVTEIFGKLSDESVMAALMQDYFYTELLKKGFEENMANTLANKLNVDIASFEADVSIKED
jgi:hypothetical protein